MDCIMGTSDCVKCGCTCLRLLMEKYSVSVHYCAMVYISCMKHCPSGRALRHARYIYSVHYNWCTHYINSAHCVQLCKANVSQVRPCISGTCTPAPLYSGGH